jgi:hypothetical protein
MSRARGWHEVNDVVGSETVHAGSMALPARDQGRW